MQLLTEHATDVSAEECITLIRNAYQLVKWTNEEMGIVHGGLDPDRILVGKNEDGGFRLAMIGWQRARALPANEWLVLLIIL